jgi:vacuolar protein sorting-associated protein 13A/C
MVTTDIQADGNSQLLVISHYDAETSVYKPAKRGQGAIRRSDSTDSITTAAFETIAISDKPNMSISIDLEGIGLSVITKSASELFYLSLRGLKLAFSDYPTYREANIDCKWIQIDNQLFGGIFPIILYPTIVPKDGKELESHPTLQTTVAVLKDNCEFQIRVK